MNDRLRPEFTLGIVSSGFVLALFAAPIFQGAVYTHDDLLNFHLPLRAFYAAQLAQGRIPVWSPDLYCGLNLHGEGQAGLLHPLHLLLYSTLPLPFAFMLEVVLPFPVVQIGMYRFLRGRGLEREGALFGSLAFAFAPALMLRFIHLNATAVLAHLPWLLLAIDAFVQSSGKRRAAAGVATALLTASQLLLGYPAFVCYSVVAEAVFALWLTVPRRDWRGLTQLAALKLLGLLLGTVQLVPTIESLARSVRRQPSAFHGDLTSRRELIVLTQWLDPYLVWFRVPLPLIPRLEAYYYIHEMSLYCGAAVPILVVWTILRRRSGAIDRRLVGAAATLGLLALVLAFIRLTPFWELYRRLPVVGLFRFNVRYYLLFNLSAAVIAAVGFADLAGSTRRGDRIAWRTLWPLALPPLASIALAGTFAAFDGRLPGLSGSLTDWPLNALGPATSATAAGLVVLAARGRRWAPAALIVLTAADLAAYNLSHIRHPLGASPDVPIAASLADVVATIPAPPPALHSDARVLDETASNRLLLKGCRLAGGYVGLTPIKALNYDDEAARRVAGMSAVLGKPRDGRQTWKPSPAPLPRVRLVARAQASRDPGRDLATVDPSQTALVPAALDLPSATPGQARIARDEGDRIDVAAVAPARQLLILAESYDPGWTVQVDGEPSEIVPVYGDFLGCVVPAGRHLLRFDYQCAGLRRGAWLSLTALAALVLWSMLARIEKPPSRSI